jgi:platelet-activating factor acetylhydrolase
LKYYRFFPRILHYISIPVLKNAPLLAPKTPNNRWPVMIFSHGLAGSRNAYSHLLGSIASHGVVVIAPEHRDCSTPISYIRDISSLDGQEEKPSSKYASRTIRYKKYPHTPTPDVEEGRNAQLKIRLWELGLIHDSLLKVDGAKPLTNLNSSSVSLAMFNDRIDVNTPGKITFGGHSFGAATIVQFVKSTFYSPENSDIPAQYQTLFTPSSRSSLISQITPSTPVILLDCWCMPLRASTTRWLWNKPMPCYAPGGAGGSALLAVESQAFYKWRVHLKATKRLLSPDPTSDAYNYPSGISEPNFYYATSSAHLSQSDFGMLFPWVTKKIFATEEPERLMRLNVRAILQVLRNCGVPVSETSKEDMEMSGDQESGETKDDKLILGKDGEVRGWHWLNTDIEELGDVDEDAEMKGKMEVGASAEPAEVVVGNELRQKPGTAERL